VTAAARTVQHLQQAVLWYGITQSDAAGLMQLHSILSTAKRAQYD